MYNTIDILIRLRILVMINVAKFNSLVEIAQYSILQRNARKPSSNIVGLTVIVSAHIVAATIATPAATAGISAASATRAFPSWWEPYSRTPIVPRLEHHAKYRMVHSP